VLSYTQKNFYCRKKIKKKIKKFFYYCYKVLLKPFNFYLVTSFLSPIVLIFTSKKNNSFFSKGCIISLNVRHSTLSYFCLYFNISKAY